MELRLLFVAIGITLTASRKLNQARRQNELEKQIYIKILQALDDSVPDPERQHGLNQLAKHLQPPGARLTSDAKSQSKLGELFKSLQTLQYSGPKPKSQYEKEKPKGPVESLKAIVNEHMGSRNVYKNLRSRYYNPYNHKMLRDRSDESELNTILRKYCIFTGRCGHNDIPRGIVRTESKDAGDDVKYMLQDLEDYMTKDSKFHNRNDDKDRRNRENYIKWDRDHEKRDRNDDRDNKDLNNDRKYRDDDRKDKERDFDRNYYTRVRNYDRRDTDNDYDRRVADTDDNDRRERDRDDDDRRDEDRDDDDRWDGERVDDHRQYRNGKHIDLTRSGGYQRSSKSNNDLNRNNLSFGSNDLRCGKCSHNDLRCGCGTNDLRCGCGSNDLRCSKCSDNDLRCGCGTNDLRCGCGCNDLRCGCGCNDLRCSKCSDKDLRCSCGSNDLRCGKCNESDNINKMNNEDQTSLDSLLKNFHDLVNDKIKRYVVKKKPADKTTKTVDWGDDIDRTFNQIFNVKAKDDAVPVRSYPPQFIDDGEMMLSLQENSEQSEKPDAKINDVDSISRAKDKNAVTIQIYPTMYSDKMLLNLQKKSKKTVESSAEINKIVFYLLWQKELISNLSLDYMTNPSLTFKIFEDHNIYLDSDEKNFLKYARKTYPKYEDVNSMDEFRKAISVLWWNYFKRNGNKPEDNFKKHPLLGRGLISKFIKATAAKQINYRNNILPLTANQKRKQQNNAGHKRSRKSQVPSGDRYGFPFQLEVEGLAQVKTR